MSLSLIIALVLLALWIAFVLTTPAITSGINLVARARRYRLDTLVRVAPVTL